MKFIDLFAGIGGFRTGLERNSHTAVGWVEVDKFARRSYEAIYDVTGEWTASDITKVTDEEIAEIGDVDVITGGFPCQSFSISGHRKGFNDTRGTLFFDVMRFAKVLRPKVLFLENVKGLVGHDNGNTLDVIVQTLNDTGYRVDFDVLNSKYFGVPQNRERIFIVAIREDLIEQDAWSENGSTVAHQGKERISQYEGTKMFNFNFPKNHQVDTHLADLLEVNVPAKYYLHGKTKEKLLNNLFDRGYGGYPNCLVGSMQKNAMISLGDMAPTLTSGMGAGGGNVPMIVTKMDEYSVRKLTPKECFRLQAYSDDVFDKAQAVNSNTQLYIQAGNSVTVNVIDAIAEEITRLLDELLV